MVAQPQDILHTIDAERYVIRDAPNILRIVYTGARDAAVADTGIELIEGAGVTVGTVSAATLSIIAAIVLVIAVLLFAFFLITFNQSRKVVNDIPFVGSHLVIPLDWIHALFMNLATWLENEFMSVWTGLLKDFHTLIAGLLALFGLPALDYLQGKVTQVHAVLSRIPYEVDALENRVMKALVDTLANVWQNINQIWHWIHVALSHIAALTHAVQQIWQWIHTILSELTTLGNLVHYILHQIGQLWNYVHNLARLVHTLQSAVQELQKETHLLQQRILVDEAKIAPALETVAIAALLLPLLDIGEEGVANLEKLARDPCRCLFEPGTKSFLETALLTYLAWKEDP